MELRVMFELPGHLVLLAYQFEKGFTRLGTLVESCLNSKRKRLPVLYRFLLSCA